MAKRSRTRAADDHRRAREAQQVLELRRQARLRFFVAVPVLLVAVIALLFDLPFIAGVIALGAVVLVVLAVQRSVRALQLEQGG